MSNSQTQNSCHTILNLVYLNTKIITVIRTIFEQQLKLLRKGTTCGEWRPKIFYR